LEIGYVTIGGERTIASDTKAQNASCDQFRDQTKDLFGLKFSPELCMKSFTGSPSHLKLSYPVIIMKVKQVLYQ